MIKLYQVSRRGTFFTLLYCNLVKYYIVLSRHIVVYFLYCIFVCFLPMWRINVFIRIYFTTSPLPFVSSMFPRVPAVTWDGFFSISFHSIFFPVQIPTLTYYLPFLLHLSVSNPIPFPIVSPYLI